MLWSALHAMLSSLSLAFPGGVLGRWEAFLPLFSNIVSAEVVCEGTSQPAPGRLRRSGPIGLAGMGNGELTEAEAKVYDRQLRVWGVEVQRRQAEPQAECFPPNGVIKVALLTMPCVYMRRLNAAKILIAGLTSGVAAEVCRPLPHAPNER